MLPYHFFTGKSSTPHVSRCRGPPAGKPQATGKLGNTRFQAGLAGARWLKWSPWQPFAGLHADLARLTATDWPCAAARVPAGPAGLVPVGGLW